MGNPSKNIEFICRVGLICLWLIGLTGQVLATQKADIPVAEEQEDQEPAPEQEVFELNQTIPPFSTIQLSTDHFLLEVIQLSEEDDHELDRPSFFNIRWQKYQKILFRWIISPNAP
jgi:hypothetical protein